MSNLDLHHNIKEFSLVRVVGTPNYVEFNNGMRLYKPAENKLYVEQWGRYVKRIDYDNHFIALNSMNKDTKGWWFAYCSCGSPAVVTGYNAYKHGASPSSGDGLIPGEMFVCMHHATFGSHQDGST